MGRAFTCSELAERVMLMSTYELLMIVVAILKLVIDIVRLHRESKNSRLDTGK